jgi:hypothetical protein
MGNSMGLILEARSSPFPFPFLFLLGSVAYGKAVIEYPMLPSHFNCGSIGDPSQMPCQDGPDSNYPFR